MQQLGLLCCTLLFPGARGQLRRMLSDKGAVSESVSKRGMRAIAGRGILEILGIGGKGRHNGPAMKD